MNKCYIVESAVAHNKEYESKFSVFTNKEKALEVRDKIVENRLYESIFNNNMSKEEASKYRENVFNTKSVYENGEVISDTDDQWFVGMSEGNLIC